MNTLQKAPPRPMLLFVVVFALMDFFIPAMSGETRSATVAWFLEGLMVGQFALLSIWAVLGAEPVLVRWPLMLLTVMGLLLILFLGMFAAFGALLRAADVIQLFCWLPLVFLAVQSPLWILKLLTGCRIVEVTAEDKLPSEESRQFDLRQMFVATALIAVLLTVARLGFYLDPRPHEGAETQMWLPLLTACLICAAWSAFATIPCLGAVFVARNPTAGLIGVIVYAGMMTWLVATGLSFISVPGPGKVFELRLAQTAGLAVVLLCSLHLLRFAGYRLLWVRRKSVAVGGDSA